MLSLIAALALAAADHPTVSLRGIGALRIGLTAAQLRRIGARPSERPDPEMNCDYWSLPGQPDLGLMVVSGRLVRIDIDGAAYRTLSGAHVGMAERDILTRYGPAMRVQPHPYTAPEGHYLVYRARGAPFGLIIETDGSRAERMRVGYWENVQWIEGCS
jgi:hypothetical protein